MMMEHLGIRWGYVFLRSANYLNPDEFHELMVQAVEMYLGGESERKVKHDSFEGRLLTEGTLRGHGRPRRPALRRRVGNRIRTGSGYFPRQ